MREIRVLVADDHRDRAWRTYFTSGASSMKRRRGFARCAARDSELQAHLGIRGARDACRKAMLIKLDVARVEHVIAFD